MIGSGHNALVAAFYLARAGWRPLVLERRSVVGGAAVTEEIAPGHRCPTLAHAIGPMRPSIVRDMRLADRVAFVHPDPRLIALSPDGRALVFSRDVPRTVDTIRQHAPADAPRYAEFADVLQRIAGLLAPLLERTPPSIDAPGAADALELLQAARRFRALGRTDQFRLLRWLPMPAADLVSEWFTDDLLQAAIAARGLFGVAAGPWSAGTGAILLMNAAMDPAPGGSGIRVKGGPGALTRALAEAAREAGATIRVDAPVSRVLVRDGRAVGVALEDGTEIPARAVVSGADPRRTLLGLVDPTELDPGFLQRVRNYRAPGVVAKVNLVLGTLPAFAGSVTPDVLGGRIHIGPDIDYLERAFDASKYGQISAEPYLDITIPSLLDPSLCPPGRHVMSICMQFAPYRLAKDQVWPAMADQLGASVVRTLEHYAPGISNTIEHRQVLTPFDLESAYGLTGGHIHHGELSLDQLFTMRPVLGWAQYRMPIEGLFLCGAGTHPGGGITGAPGRNAAREIVKALRG
ncbi:MAG: phytoene desaturase family protein [Vicinamibacterales bacterium]